MFKANTIPLSATFKANISATFALFLIYANKTLFQLQRKLSFKETFFLNISPLVRDIAVKISRQPLAGDPFLQDFSRNSEPDDRI